MSSPSVQVHEFPFVDRGMIPDTQTPQVIAWQELIVGDPLADGSFAVVYRAEYKGQPVAVKKWKSQEFNQRELDMFKREVESNSYVR
jgi:hypothetical protein